MITVDWKTFKSYVDARSISVQFVDANGNYYMKAIFDKFELSCILNKSLNSDDTAEFEANYKGNGNQPFFPMDSDRTPIVRTKIVKAGSTFRSQSSEVTFSTLTGLLAKKNDASDVPNMSCSIFDGGGNQIVSSLLANTAVKTVIDWEPTFDYELIGHRIRILSNSLVDVRLWIVVTPDIADSAGGSIEIVSGMNLRYLPAGQEAVIDARVAKLLQYNAVSHSNKIRFIFKYPVTTNNTVMVSTELYR